ncbi:FixH family protein [Pseudaestuariivita atlantica]|uniref:FixH protein n=1 Tax=Pseudaestuariivita atlantica TaxID=1317121 RepID=A0A0L1JTZ9_9RHOB|nr:FixH family protein [Pseudaestuariivita atlantica]KNG95236.1 FixH protein [Pseudaestuariivita atlantica]
MKQVTGFHVFAMFALGFGIIISVNLALAFSAVRTFPGLEVKNSYVASQTFDADRAAQLALGWDVSARLDGDLLILSILKGGAPVEAVIEQATFGRAHTVNADQEPAFAFDGRAYTAPVEADGGNWNLRLVARAADGTLFRQRIVVDTPK